LDSGTIKDCWAGFWSKQLLMYDSFVLTSEKLYVDRKY
jgi:hypothetical protein